MRTEESIQSCSKQDLASLKSAKEDMAWHTKVIDSLSEATTAEDDTLLEWHKLKYRHAKNRFHTHENTTRITFRRTLFTEGRRVTCPAYGTGTVLERRVRTNTLVVAFDNHPTNHKTYYLSGRYVGNMDNKECYLWPLDMDPEDTYYE